LYIDVRVRDQTTVRASVVGYDARRDLAVLRACCVSGVVPLTFLQTRSARLGEEAFVLGYPLGFESVRVTKGIVSGFSFDSAADREVVQTDAAINSGNSGGPLLTLSGEVIGVNTFKIVRTLSGDTPVEGTGFAISSVTVTRHLGTLKSGATVALPTPTPDARAPAGVYTHPTLGYRINVPSGWIVDDPSGDLRIADPNHEISISVYTEAVDSTKYPTIRAFRRDWRIRTPTTWTSFKVVQEQYIRVGSEVEGYEYQIQGVYQGTSYQGFLHWFVTKGVIYEVFGLAPTSILSSEAGKQVDRTYRLAMVSFQPPR
jgi:hypothetical protein